MPKKKQSKDKIKLNDMNFDEVMSSDFPRIYVHSMDDQSNGDCLMTFDTNKAFDEMYKKRKNRKRVTRKGIGNFILEILTKALNKEDGYELKPLKGMLK